MIKSIYTNRKLSEGYPNLEKIGAEYFSRIQNAQPLTAVMIKCIERLINVSNGLGTVVVVGCGPNPYSVKELLELGYDATGVDTNEEYVHSGRIFLGNPQRLRMGSAEALPFEENSIQILLMESVLEHVDSPTKSLGEAYRVLVPGGVLYVSTTNRWKFSLKGKNGEFRTRFYNWLPSILKESYVFLHLHYQPSLANYSERPAVHWFSYPDLCRLGREAGFAKFYSWIDLVDEDSPIVAKSHLRRLLLNKVRYNPWLRSLALTQAGGSIFMLKRPG